MITPDSKGRIPGTTYPDDRAPPGAVPLGERRPSLRARLASFLVGAALEVLHPGEGDIVVVRGARPDANRVAALQRLLHKGKPGDPVAVFLPYRCAVHVEPRRLQAEDRGYRETKVTSNDMKKTPERGVFTGVPDARDPE